MTDQSTPATASFSYSGEMTIYNAEENFQRLKEQIEQQLPLHLDLSAVTEVDSSGLQLLLFAQAEADAHDLGFSIVAISEAVDDACKLVQLKRTFGIEHLAPPETPE